MGIYVPFAQIDRFIISSVPLFAHFFLLYKKILEYHIHIWQMPLQLSCGDNYEIWMRLKVSNMFFRMIEIRTGASTQHTSTSTGKSVLEYNIFSIFMFIILGKTSTRVVLAPALIEIFPNGEINERSVSNPHPVIG